MSATKNTVALKNKESDDQTGRNNQHAALVIGQGVRHQHLDERSYVGLNSSPAIVDDGRPIYKYGSLLASR